MATLSAVQSNFTGGEFSERLLGRSDTSKFFNGLVKESNFISTVIGDMYRRSGSQFVAKGRVQDKEIRVQEFQFSTLVNYVLEFGDQYVRFYRDRTQITQTLPITGVVTGTKTFTVAGDHTDEIQTGDEFTVTGSTGNDGTFTVASVSLPGDTDIVVNEVIPDATVDGSIVIPYAISTPYLAEELVKLKFTQSADVLYITHPDHQPRQLNRFADTNWTITLFDFQDGPYLNQNTTATTLSPNGNSGTVTVTADSTVGINGGDGFKSTDVGRLITIEDSAGKLSWMEITVFTSTTVVDALIRGPDLVVAQATTVWRLGAWSDTDGWPHVATFHQLRLWFGATDFLPQTLWASIPDDFTNFAPTDVDGTVLENSALDRTLDDDQVNIIRWIVSLSKGLIIGTSGGEFAGRASTLGLPITPTDFVVRRQSNVGSHPTAMPVKIAASILYPQEHGREVYDLKFRFESDQFDPQPTTTLAEHITKTTNTSQIKEMKYQQSPDRMIVVVLSDGSLIANTFQASEDVNAWYNLPIGGTDAEVESVAVVSDAPYDLPWLVVKRTINGATTRYIEFLQDKQENYTDIRDTFFSDSGLRLDNPLAISGATQADPVVVTATAHGFANEDLIDISDVKGMTEINDRRFKAANVTANTFDLTDVDTDAGIDGTGFSAYKSDGNAREAITTISGLGHLEGEQVSFQADGSPSDTDGLLTVTNGEVTLSEAASRVVVGLPYTSEALTLPLEAIRSPIEPRGKIKSVSQIELRFWRSLGGKVSFFKTDDGKDGEDGFVEEIAPRDTQDDMDKVPALLTALIPVYNNAQDMRDIQMRIVQDQPAPLTLLNLIVEYVTDAP